MTNGSNYDVGWLAPAGIFSWLRWTNVMPVRSQSNQKPLGPDPAIVDDETQSAQVQLCAKYFLFIFLKDCNHPVVQFGGKHWNIFQTVIVDWYGIVVLPTLSLCRRRASSANMATNKNDTTTPHLITLTNTSICHLPPASGHTLERSSVPAVASHDSNNND